jgi:small-conductance mechanosensitive channel
MDSIFELVEGYLGISQVFQIKILKTFLVILFIWVLKRVGSGIADKFSDSNVRNYNYRKAISRIVWTLALIIIADIWLEGLTSLATYLGLVSAGIAIALKDPLTDIAGWFFITLRKPFEMSHRIEIGVHKGDVVDIRIFKFTILEIGGWVGGDQPTGRVIHLPNSIVFRESVANYTVGFNFIWDEIKVLITFESDWRRAKGILKSIVDKQTESSVDKAEKEIQTTTKKYLIKISQTKPSVITSVHEYGIALSVRYLVRPTRRRMLNEILWEDILEAFSKEKNIHFAYPTTRFYREIDAKDNLE